MLTRRNRISNVVEHIAFDLEDDKGRGIGVSVVRSVDEFEDAPELQHGFSQAPGRYFGARVQATRGSNKFGALQPVRFFSREADREQYIADRVSGSKARYADLQVLR